MKGTEKLWGDYHGKNHIGIFRRRYLWGKKNNNDDRKYDGERKNGVSHLIL